MSLQRVATTIHACNCELVVIVSIVCIIDDNNNQKSNPPIVYYDKQPEM